MHTSWPTTPDDLGREQARLAALAPPPWAPPDGPLRVAGCAVVFGRGGVDGVAWAAAVVEAGAELVAATRDVFRVDAPYGPGLLALREGPILEAVVRALAAPFEVLLVAAAGRDHPRRAGLALHLGAALGVPTAGVTDDPLAANGPAPGDRWGARAPLRLGGEVVGYRVRTRKGAKPVVAHAAWRTSPEIAAEVVLGATSLARWPEPLRAAREGARDLRARAGRPRRGAW